MIIGGKVFCCFIFFLLQFLFFLFHCQILGPIFEEQHIYLESFIFKVCHWKILDRKVLNTRKFLFSEIPEVAHAFMGRGSFFNLLLWNTLSIFSRNNYPVSKVLLENTTLYSTKKGFTLLSTVFRTACIWMRNNMIEGNLWNLPTPTKNSSYIPACSYSLSKYFFRVSGAAATNLLAAFQSSEQHNSFPKREGINLISEVWQSRAIQCLVCSSWDRNCKESGAYHGREEASREGVLHTSTWLFSVLVWKLYWIFAWLGLFL